MFNLRGLGVLPTVDFDDQARGETNKIAEIWAEGKLTAKTKAVNLLAAQFLPQQLFGFGGLLAQGARTEGCFTPPPNPLP